MVTLLIRDRVLPEDVRELADKARELGVEDLVADALDDGAIVGVIGDREQLRELLQAVDWQPATIGSTRAGDPVS